MSLSNNNISRSTSDYNPSKPNLSVNDNSVDLGLNLLVNKKKQRGGSGRNSPSSSGNNLNFDIREIRKTPSTSPTYNGSSSQTSQQFQSSNSNGGVQTKSVNIDNVSTKSILTNISGSGSKPTTPTSSTPQANNLPPTTTSIGVTPTPRPLHPFISRAYARFYNSLEVSDINK